MASITNLEKRLYSLTFTDELNVITSLVELQQQISAATDAERRQMKERLLKSNVPHLLCATLKQDFSKVPGTWSHVTRLANLLVIVVQVPHSSNPFLTDTSKELLSDITESVLILLRRLQKRLSSARSQSEKTEMSPNEFIVLIKKVLADLHGLVEWYVEAADYIANSPWFLQLFIVDDPQLMEWFTTLLIKCVQRKPAIVEHWNQNQKVNILDELIYHFAVIDSVETVDQTLHCLLTLLNCDHDLRLLVLRRYRGIHLLVTRWLTYCCSDSGGVESPTDSAAKQKLLSLLEILGDKRTRMPTTLSEGTIQGQTERSESRYSEEEAATVIQAAWRGTCTRKKLHKAHKGFALFQKRFRERQTQMQHLKQGARMEAEFQHFVRLTRRRRYREQLELEFQLLSSLPAPLVDRQQSQKREEAVIIIQAFFRGFHVRLQLAKQKEHLRKDRAARIIQQHFRQHLSRLDCLATTKPRIPQDHHFLSGEYSEAIRKLARQRHQYWCDTHPVSCKSREQLEQLHRTVQQRLKLFQVNRIKSKLQVISPFLINRKTSKWM
ncbi:hypothetical protein PHET_08549 [Paragonimus heterotremus]|uniref:IQ calmodulin-binding motif-containing protein 1 n=1 Tax=Paragonimus heterotremus TaxID=100268 RepID=A0A8J4T3X3_9TREM|nr:hypothetical protein PHET_08549 [Paragonimus heterotremus]